MEKLTEERDQRIAAENRDKEQNKRLQRQLRDTKEEMGELARKEAEASRKKHELVIPTCQPTISHGPQAWRPPE
jgi:myosin-18